MSKITNKELTDQGICPTCYDREHNHIVFGDNSDKMLYEDKEKINNLRKRLNWYPTIELKQLKRVDNIDLDEYIKFREQVKNNMSNPDWLGDFEKKDLKQLLKEGAKIWIYYLNKTPICSMMCLPTEKDFLENLDIEYDEDSIVDYGPMFVNYDYIGNNLQYQMLKELDKLSKENGYQYAITTVHPDNIYSSNNLKLDKFHCFRTKSLPRGIREIYIKKL